MKFTKHAFLVSLFSVQMFTIIPNCAADCSLKSDAGKYCPKWGSHNTACPANCYCDGGSKTAVGDASSACATHDASKKATLASGGVHYCGEDGLTQFFFSNKGSSKKTDCYVSAGGVTYYRNNYTPKCDPGKYIPQAKFSCTACPSGYVCPGMAANSFVFDPYKDQGLGKKCGTNETPNHSANKCDPKPADCSSGQYNDGSTCKSCPDGFPKSNSNATKKEDCYYVSPHGNGNIFYKTISCPPGEYFPRDSNAGAGTCKKCSESIFCLNCDVASSSARGYICTGTGGTVTPKDTDQGVKKCETGTHPNTAQTECLSDSKQCDSGKYLPANSETCAVCTENICSGGTFNFATYDQGLGQKCVAPEKPNHNTGKCDRDMITCIKGTYLPANSPLGTECSACPSNKVCPGGSFEIMRNIDQGVLDKEKISVEPGYYLPKNSDEPKKCTSTSKYCPGDKFEPSTSRDQGIFDCPKNSRANDAKTACTITLTKKQLMYGVNGTGGKYSENALQCWTKKDEADYKACMGFTADGGYKPTDKPGIGKVFKEVIKLDLTKGVAAKEKANVMQASFGGLEK